jgi:hypothetical protein
LYVRLRTWLRIRRTGMHLSGHLYVRYRADFSIPAK